MTHYAEPGDTRRFATKDVTLLDSAFVAQPVTTGLTGTLTILDWETNAVQPGSPHSLIQSGATDDWYVDTAVPSAEGRYRLKFVLTKSGATQTLWDELRVQTKLA